MHTAAATVKMSFLASAASVISKIVSVGPALTEYGLQQTRNRWTKARNIRDMKRRAIAKEYAPERLRLLGLKRNKILPSEIKDLASKAFEDIPRQSALRQLTPRCVITGRGYGTVVRWRMSRFIFRHLVDYNKMAGIQRAMW